MLSTLWLTLACRDRRESVQSQSWPDGWPVSVLLCSKTRLFHWRRWSPKVVSGTSDQLRGMPFGRNNVLPSTECRWKYLRDKFRAFAAARVLHVDTASHARF